MKNTMELNVKLFADGADKTNMLRLYHEPCVQGFTTNPTLMNKAGIANYRAFCKDILRTIQHKPISFEVFSDDFLDMERQAMEIAGWGDNVYVKIPITNTKKEPSGGLIKRLTTNQVKVNVTAVMSCEQVSHIIPSLHPSIPSYVSVFAGRIADTGRDPLPLMSSAIELLKVLPCTELIWASPRELLNVIQANTIGCPIITVTHDILKKLPLLGLDLHEYSLDTVKMFYNDAVAAGFYL